MVKFKTQQTKLNLKTQKLIWLQIKQTLMYARIFKKRKSLPKSKFN